MKLIKHSLAIAIILFSVTSCNNKPTDKEIQDNVTKKLQDNNTDKSINASVKNGVVTLTGSCEGDNCDSTAIKNVKDVDGVETVENNIQSTTKTDLTLRSSVLSIISKYQGVEADVAGGVVVLRGTIDKSQLQPLMTELTSLNPKKIDNQLAVK